MLLFKVDFEKAYDSVEMVEMVKMNFPTLWTKWIFECIGSAKASVLVNDCPECEKNTRRGVELC